MIQIGDCPRCRRKRMRITKGVCHNCYRRFIWIKKKVECKNCKQMRANHAKGYCSNCYNKLFKYDRIKSHNIREWHKIDLETHRRITKECAICGFDKIVDLHHIDRNHENNSPENLIGLCPNHHKMMHMDAYRGELVQILNEKRSIVCYTKV